MTANSTTCLLHDECLAYQDELEYATSQVQAQGQHFSFSPTGRRWPYLDSLT